MAGDARLAVATSAGVALAAPYHVDASDAVRGAAGVWDRGALEFGAGGPPAPPLSVTLNQPTFRPADILMRTVRAVAGVVPTAVDAYVVLQAGSAIFSLQADGRLVPGLVPLARQVELPSVVVPLSFPLAAAPPGTYVWLAGVTLPGTLTLVTPVQTTPFAIVP